MNDRPENDDQEPVAPPRLIDALRSLHNQKPLVPPSVDEAILGRARAHLTGKGSVGARPSPGAATPELRMAKVSPESHAHTGATAAGERGSALEIARSGRAHVAAAGDGRTPVAWFRAISEQGRGRLPSGWALAAAAVVVLGLGVGLLVNRRINPPAAIAREDVDRNGKVDILDAFALARKLQQGRTAGTALDLNGDGVVDQRDIDWVAARAVKLHKG